MSRRRPSLRSPRYVRRTSELRRVVERLRRENVLAVDTESNSLYAYQEQVCLIQLSSRDQDYIIDPLAMDNMEPLGELFADPAIEIVFHAAEYDVISLKRDFGYTFGTIFDTMQAARICGWSKTGLGNILAEQFGVVVEKRFQRADWSKRPLPPEQLRYAQMDTHFLPILRDRLTAELAEKKRLQEAREIFSVLPELSPAKKVFDPAGFWRIHQIRGLSPQQIAIVRELYLLRDALARRYDRPPFKIFGDQVLVALAELEPRRPADLLMVKGLGSRLVQRDGAAILEAVARGRQAPPPAPPKRKQRPDPEVTARYEALRVWRKQRAAERGVESDVILPRDTMWALAHRVPSREDELNEIPGLGPWRRAKYGAELLAVLEQVSRELP